MGFKGIPKFNMRKLSWASSSSSSLSESNNPLIDPEKQNYTDSPPSSPTLIPVDNQPSQPRKSLFSRCIQLLVWSLIGAFIFWAVGSLVYSAKKFETHLLALKNHNGETEVVHWFKQPEESTAVFFADADLNNRWTVSVPRTETFPLSPQKLAHICIQSHKMHHQLHMDDEHIGHPSYYQADPDYMQVSEAVSSGMLPAGFPSHITSVVEGVRNESHNGSPDNTDEETDICKRSLTFVMQSADAGFGPTLMSLWLAYGMAVYEKRAFFIDDRNWAYGSWSTFFAPPPSPSCKPAPEIERVPCPHQADHLVVSTATSTWTFGHGFEDEFEDPRKMEVQRQINIFRMMREGYEALFHLASDDAAYLDQRLHELNSTIRPGLSVGLHMRHGDKHPYTQQFSKTYIPPEQYVIAANHELFAAFNPNTTANEAEADSKIAASRMILASDDAEAYTYWSEDEILRAQDRIVLSTPSQNNITGTVATVPLPFEGGFFARNFTQIKGSASWFSTDPALDYRALLGRSYLLDLAVLGNSDRVVCTVNSIGCRLLAVIMGWEDAIAQKHWINVDGAWEWAGVVW
ncbi:MAG: hypothetical protein GOMPHAMPRED_002805 [Gomphillus americanus]|uniref:Uncharacterized protein n=1 Tax=Gomphillus americanus TaxID=1940652 RepID=A0A8H3FIA9_9LECA|nr:MAG: hypothetical protein GOMPHAMPRED_002805 [Gomphillus americanus]